MDNMYIAMKRTEIMNARITEENEQKLSDIQDDVVLNLVMQDAIR